MAGAQPDVADVHVDALLTELSIGYKPGGFIADEVFQIVPVDKQTDVYATYNKSFWARDEGSSAASTGANRMLRAPGTNAAATGFTVNKTATYRADNFAIGVELPDELIANADAVFNLESDATLLVSTLQRLRRERAFAGDFMTTGVWTTDQTVTAKFNNYGASTPIEDFRTAIRTIRRQALATPGGRITLTLGALTWDRLADHPDLLERIKYTQTGIVAPDLLASLLTNAAQYPVDVLIAQSVVTADEEGTAEASVTYSDVISDNALLTYRTNGPSRLMPSSGSTFVWTPMVGGGRAIEFIRRIREERPKKTIIESHSYWDQVATLVGTGVYFNDATD